jgi:hypothetical protein
MQSACIHCGADHQLKDADVAGHAKVQFHCSQCGQTTVVEIRVRADSTVVISPLPSFARVDGTNSGLRFRGNEDGLRLPREAHVVLTVVSGPSRGVIYKLEKPQIILGRKGADVPLDDPEVSRFHCLIEVKDQAISLKDLDSTNGTFFDEERARAAVLMDGSEFRIGTSVVRLTLEPK